jgi:hypothetical protein
VSFSRVIPISLISQGRSLKAIFLSAIQGIETIRLSSHALYQGTT